MAKAILDELNMKANTRPGQSKIIQKLRGIANSIRTLIVIDICNRWIKRKGFVRVPFSVDFWSPNRKILLGDRVQFGANCLVHCDAVFGDSILIARNVAFVGRDDHRYDLIGKQIWDSPRGDKFCVVVENDVWIGHGAIVLSGVKIGTGSIVAAGSVVKDDVPPYSIVAGNPAHVIRPRFRDHQID